jgi:hypothetical protein
MDVPTNFIVLGESWGASIG